MEGVWGRVLCRCCCCDLLEGRGVLEFAGGGNGERLGDGDADVEGGEFTVEFTLVEVGERVPAFTVVDGGFGVPLGYVVVVVGVWLVGVGFEVGGGTVAAAGKVVGQLDVEGGGQGDLASGWQGIGKDDLYDVDMLGMVFHPGLLVVDSEVEAVYIPSLLAIGEIEVGSSVAEQLLAESCLIVLVGVGPAVDPDEFQGVGAMVAVLDLYEAFEGALGVVEGDVDGIVDLLLPMGLGGAGEGAGDTYE